jgi:tetratricopeptide (TPR) repeat protein
VTVATGARDEAMAYLRRFVVAVGDKAEGLAQAADGFARLGRFDDAFELAARAKNPDGALHELAQIPLGLALAHRGEFAAALPHLTIGEPDAVVLTARLRVRIALGDLTGATKDAREARDVEEPTPEMRAAVADVQTLGQRLQELRRSAAESVVRSEPGQKALEQFACAEYLFLRGEWLGRVEALVNEALAADEKPGAAFGLRAVLYLERGRLATALADAEQAIVLATDDCRGYLARGRVRQERGAEGALTDLEKAVTLSQRRDGTVLHAWAAALAQAGRREEALAAQREASRLLPSNIEVREQLRELEAVK